jgi:hypothetical protein
MFYLLFFEQRCKNISKIRESYPVPKRLLECKNLHPRVRFARYDVSYEVGLPPHAPHGHTLKLTRKACQFFRAADRPCTGGYLCKRSVLTNQFTAAAS